MRRGNREHLGLAAAAHEAEDPVADGQRVDVRPEAHDFAGELEPGNVGRPACRGGVEAGALGEIGAVQPGTVHTDEHLAVARFGIGPGLDHELLVHDHGARHEREGTCPMRSLTTSRDTRLAAVRSLASNSARSARSSPRAPGSPRQAGRE